MNYQHYPNCTVLSIRKFVAPSDLMSLASPTCQRGRATVLSTIQTVLSIRDLPVRGRYRFVAPSDLMSLASTTCQRETVAPSHLWLAGFRMERICICSLMSLASLTCQRETVAPSHWQVPYTNCTVLSIVASYNLMSLASHYL